ncbi:MAG: multidrug ABC transporter [Lachnospiraceae bacterium]|nr:multidrug ABC transporter [Lachnospiraceae bacterium]
MALCVIIMVCSELLASSSQVLLKKSAGITYPSRIREYLNRYVICGYGMLFISMMLTILAYRFAVSYMNIPVLETMGYIFVLILGRLVFREKITLNKALGVILIFCGIVLFHI